MSETYILTESVSILTGGQNQVVGDIEIEAPTGKIQNIFSRLEAEYGKLQKIKSDEGKEQLKEMSAEQIEASFKALNESKAKQEDSVEVKEVSVEERMKEFFEQVRSSGFDLSNSYSLLKDILLQKNNGAQMVTESGSKFKMESGHWDKLPMKEIKGLLGFYIINFIAGLD